MKVRITKSNDEGDSKSSSKEALFAAWGDQAATAKNQGWYPETSVNGVTTYRSNYSPAFNDVIINPITKEKGHIALIGNNNQKFNIVIRDNNGNIVHTIASSQTPQDVQTYLTNAQGIPQQRVNIASNLLASK